MAKTDWQMDDTVMPADMNQIGQEINDLNESVEAASNAATANAIIKRDASGRAKVVAPVEPDDIARKAEVDTVQTNLNNHILESNNIERIITRKPNSLEVPQAGPLYFKTKGRLLANIMGRAGGAENGIDPGWVKTGNVTISDTVRRGEIYPYKFTAENSPALMTRMFNYKLDESKGYIAAVWVYYESVSSGIFEMRIGDYTDPGTTKFTVSTKSPIGGAWDLIYAIIPKYNTISGEGFRVTAGFTQSNSTGVVYVDEMRIYELSDDDYISIMSGGFFGEDIENLFPYVSGVQPLQGAYITRTGKNLLPPVTMMEEIHYEARIIGPYELKVNATGSSRVSYYSIPVAPNTQHTLYVEHNAKIAVYNDTGRSSLVAYTTNTSATFNTGVHSRIRVYFSNDNLGSGEYYWRNMQLEIGSESTQFEPYNEQIGYCPVPLYSSVDGSNPDVYDSETGQAFRYWKIGRKLDGSLEWIGNSPSNNPGNKSIGVTGYFFNSASLGYGTRLGLKYNGDIIPSSTKGGGIQDPTNTINVTSQNLYMKISNSESGWIDNINPSSNAIKAFMNGWKANGNNGSIYNSWVSILTGETPASQAESYVSRNKSPGWDSYGLIYFQTFNPTIEQVDVKPSGLSLNKGGSMIQISEGMILREKVTPSLSSSTYYINDTNLSSSLLRYRANRILRVYKNNEIDNNWTIQYGTGSNAYGTGKASMPSAFYDSTADYYVDYLIADKRRYTSYLNSVSVRYVESMGSTVYQNTKDIASLKTATSGLSLILSELDPPPVKSVAGKTGAVSLEVKDISGLDSRSLQLGFGAVTSIDTVALGGNATGAYDSVVVGFHALAGQYGTVAVGCNARADLYGGIAIGRYAFAYSSFDTTVGSNAAASNGTTVGGDSQARNGSIAFGQNATALGKGSSAIGKGTSAPNANEGVLGGNGAEQTSNWKIPGTLTVAGTKNFEIPHPAPHKKHTHVIRHGAVESPTAGDTLYRYTVKADTDGETVEVQLPDYFEYLNANVDVWVNGHMHFGRAFGWVEGDTLKVTCEKAGEYKVLIIGTRKDDNVQDWYVKGVEREIGESWLGETYVFEVDEIIEIEEIKEVSA